jgi:hypothetical protein
MYPASVVSLIALFTEAAFYGLYVASLIHCLRWLVFTDDGWKQRDRINKLMLITTILIFLLSTLNLAFTLPFQLYLLGANIVWSTGEGVINELTVWVPILIVDAVMIYRCWTVYNYSWRVVCLPIIFWFGSLICAVLILYYYWVLAVATGDSSTLTRMLVRVLHAEIGFYSSNIATNLFSTCAIIYRIIRVANASRNRSKRLYNTARILAESGILYTSMTVFCLIGLILVTHPDGGRDFLSSMASTINYSIAGITFNIILIRVYRDRLRLTDSYADTSTLFTTDLTTPESQATHQANEEHCAAQDGHARGD